MGEPEARRAIAAGIVTINGDRYNILKHSSRHCDGCAFYTGNNKDICPEMASKICCTGGNILVKNG